MMVLLILGGKNLIGYDIGCVFGETVRRSSLGPQFAATGSRVCVNAFHGYSHSYNCQVHHHPNVIKGIGIEDLETLERIFSGSNFLATLVRYASPYRRHQLITLYFQHADHEKYGNTGCMLYNNFKQAREIVTKQAVVLEQTLVTLNITKEELAQYCEEERAFFETLHEEPEANHHAIAYVEALQALQKAK